MLKEYLFCPSVTMCLYRQLGKVIDIVGGTCQPLAFRAILLTLPTPFPHLQSQFWKISEEYSGVSFYEWQVFPEYRNQSIHLEWIANKFSGSYKMTTSALTHIMPLVSFASSFLIFWGGIEGGQWDKIGLSGLKQF